MSFFQNSIISKYQKSINKQLVAAANAKFKAHFHNPAIQENIRNSKEEQYQEGFLTDLFVIILGYIKNPNPGFASHIGCKKSNNRLYSNNIEYLTYNSIFANFPRKY
jgi:hypothetical protein